MRRTKILTRRSLAVAVALCTSAFIGLVSAAPAAQAAPPFDHQNFFPNDTTGLTDQGADPWHFAAVLGDKDDGLGLTAHLTAVATEDTTEVNWYHCPIATGDEPLTTTEVNNCTFIANDTSPRQPSDPTAFSISDEAYDIEWDIPASQDDQRRDILSLACIGAPSAGAEPGTNCRDELEQGIAGAGVYLEDTSTGSAPQQFTGEWFKYDPCDDAGGGCSFSSDNQLFDLLHGINVPNTGFGASARSSVDLTDVEGCVFATVDAQTEYAAGAGDDCDADTSPDTTTSIYNEYNDIDLDPPDNDEMSLGLSDDFDTVTSDVPECTHPASPDECVLDAHYLVSVETVTAQIHIHNDELPDSPDDFSDDGDTFCEDENRRKDDNIDTFAAQELIVCSWDNFTTFGDHDGQDGDNEKDFDHDMDEDSTIVLSGAGKGSFEDDASPTGADTGCDDEADEDGDGLFETCYLSGSNYESAYFVATANGPVTATVCHDPESQDDTSPDQGCADETVIDSLTKTAGATHDHVHLRFAEDVTTRTGPGACHTGAVSKTKPAATNVPLVGCVQDFGHNGAANVNVIWRVIAGIPAQFVSVEQTTDSNGTADASITAPGASEGSATTMRFCTDANNNGVCDSDPSEIGTAVGCANCQADVQITWTRAAGPAAGSCPQVGGYKKKAGNKENNKLKGGPSCDKLVGKAGNDKLSGKGEDDLLKGGSGFDVCRGGPGKDIFRGCEVKKKGSQVRVG